MRAADDSRLSFLGFDSHFEYERFFEPAPDEENGTEKLPTCMLILENGKLAVGYQSTRQVEFSGEYVKDGETQLQPRTLALDGIPRSLAEADVNGDGYTELLVAYGDEWVHAISLTETLGAEVIDVRVRSPGLIPLHALARDLNSDGQSELLTLHHMDLSYGILGAFGQEGAALRLQPDAYVGQSPSDFALGDLDRDGRLDLLVANKDAKRVSYLRGTGLAQPGKDAFYGTTQVPTGASPLAVAAADLNGDGAAEVFALNAVDQTLSVLANSFSRLKETALLPTGPGSKTVETADMDCDGYPDVVVLLQGAQKATALVYLGDGQGGLGPDAHRVDLTRSAADLLLTDGNGDGKRDLVVATATRSS